MRPGAYIRVTDISLEVHESFTIRTEAGHDIFVLFEDGKLSFYNQVSDYWKGVEGVQYARLDGTWTSEVRDGK